MFQICVFIQDISPLIFSLPLSESIAVQPAFYLHVSDRHAPIQPKTELNTMIADNLYTTCFYFLLNFITAYL